MPWSSSTRGSRLPKDWRKRLAATRERAAGLCEAVEHDYRCDGIGRECDHHQRGDDHSLENLRWLNEWCHKAKTQREAGAARLVRRASTKRPARIPGLIE